MRAALRFLRDAAWLHGDRTRAYARIMMLAMALTLGFGWATTVLGHHPGGQVIAPGLRGATDFVSFWSAARLVLAGHPAAPYEVSQLAAQEYAVVHLDPGSALTFYYPPPFLLMCVPFGLLTYLGGFFVWLGVQTALLLPLLRRLEPAGWGWTPILGFPGLLVNAATGQNGFFTAAAFAGGALLLDSQPVLAGLCLGCLVVKPHLAVAVPVVLVAGRRWRALLATGGTAAGLMLVSWAVLGTSTWVGFYGNLAAIKAGLEAHPEDWHRLLSIQTAARSLGANLAWSYLWQSAAAAAALAASFWIGLARPDGRMAVAVAVVAAPLCTPHIFDYDMAGFAVPLLVLASRAQANGWRSWEKLTCLLVCQVPLVGRLASEHGVPVGPEAFIALLWLLARRVAADAADAAQGGSWHEGQAALAQAASPNAVAG